MNYPNDYMTAPTPSLVSRMYNGLDARKSYPVIVLTKPVMPVIKKPWWKRLLGL